MTNVQEYPENIIVYDGVCKLCNGFVNFILNNDLQAQFYFCSAQSDLGEVLMVEAGAEIGGDPIVDYRSVLLVRNWGQGRHEILLKSTAFFRIVSRLSWPWRALGVLRLAPLPVRDLAYDWVAKNRYRFFGRYQVCRLPNPKHQARFLG